MASKTKSTTAQAMKAYVTKTQVRQIIQGTSEPKVYSTQTSGNITATGGSMFNFTNGIIEGDDINMRSGTKIEVRTMSLRIRAIATASNVTVRFVLFSDTMNVGAFPTTAQILPTSGIMSHYSDVRQRQQHRYRILHDETLDVSTGGPSLKSVHVELPRRFPIYYNGATAVAASEGKGAISMLVIADNNLGNFDYDFQIVYSDY